MPIYPKTINYDVKPSEVIKQLAHQTYFMSHIRELVEGEEIPKDLIVGAIIEYLDTLYDNPKAQLDTNMKRFFKKGVK